jgi:hypothetical protein
MAKIQIKNSFITSSADITISSSMVKFSSGISAKNITGSFSGSIPALTSYYKQGGNSFGTTAILGTNDNQALTFETNNSEKVRITTDGNVGIGTTSPATTLNVSGSTRISAGELQIEGNNAALRLYRTSGINYFDWASGQNLYLGTVTSVGGAGRTNKMVILDSGNVGIGTNAPTQRLDLSGSLRIRSSGTYSDPTDNAGFINYDSQGGLFTISARSNGGSTYMAFRTSNSGTGGERMRIINDGNVGIGTSSPGYKLDVYTSDQTIARFAGTNSSQIVRFGNTAATQFTDLIMSVDNGQGEIFRNGSANSSYGGASSLNIWNSNGPIAFHPNNTTNAMFLSSAGNLGIGTTSPTALLTMFKTSFDSDADGFKFGYSSDYHHSFSSTFNSTTALNNLGININTGFNTGRTRVMTLLGNGNVGIGTSSPGTKLTIVDASPTVRLQDTNTSVAGGVYGTIDWLSSDSSMPGGLAAKIDVLDDGGSFGDRGAIRFFTNNATSLGERVRISSNGNVGIGTTNPFSKLDVRGNLYVNYGSNGTGYIQTNGSDSDLQITIATNLTTLMNTGGSGAMAFGAGNSERMRILSGGNVGIGTSSPGSLLHLQSSATTTLLRIDNSNINNDAAILLTDNNNPTGEGLRITYDSSAGDTYFNNIFTASTRAFNFQKGDFGSGTDLLTILNNGNVGIGTNSPTSQLQLSGSLQIGNGTNFGNKLTIYDNFTDGKIAIALRQSTGASVGDDIFSLYCNSTTGEARLLADDDNGVGFMTFYMNASERMRITNGGNVGIGTTSPISLLDVRSGYVTAGTGVSTSGTTILAGYYTSGHLTVLGTEQSSGGPVLGYAVTPSTSTTGAFLSSTTITIPRSAYTQDGGTHRWFTGPSQTVAIGSAVTSSEKMRLDTNGNLGIGTSSPATLLHVDTAGADARIRVSAGTNTVQGGMIANSGTSLIYAGSITNHGFSLRTNDTDRVRIDTSGNVGIGTSTLFAKFVVSNGSGENIEFTPGNATVNGGLIESINRSSGTTRPDLNLFTSNGSNGSIKFYTNGVNERMRITAVGNVGIGTSNPNAKLHIDDASTPYIRITRTGTPTWELRNNYPSTEYGFSINNVTAGTTVLFAGQSGNVGIGTTSPSALLHVSGSSTSLGGLFNGRLFVGTTTGVGQDFVSVRYNSGGTYSQAINIVDSNSSASGAAYLVLRKSDDTYIGNIRRSSTDNAIYIGGNSYLALGSSDTERVRIDGSGNLGIGTTSINAKLDVLQSSTSNNQFKVYSNDGTAQLRTYSTSDGYGLIINQYYAVAGSPYLRSADFVASTGDVSSTMMRFFTKDYSSNPAERVRITSDGNVGIGTSSPAYKLDVAGSIYSSNYFSVLTAATYGPSDNSAAMQVFGSTGSGGLTNTIKFVTGGSERARIASDGNVGIGTNNPFSKTTISRAGVSLPTTADSTNNAHLTLAGSNSLVRLQFGTQNVTPYGGWIQASYDNTGGDNGVEPILINPLGGNVGIGTDNPTARLHIVQVNSGGVPAIRLSSDESTIQGPSANTQIRMGSNLVLNASNVMPFNVNASETMRIINNGNIGIGTTTPLGKLHVYGLLRVGGAANEQTGIIALGNDAHPTGTYGDNGMFRGGIGTLGSSNYTNIGSYQGIVFNVQNAAFGSQATRMIIDVNGNVGIGTTSPGAKLDVNGDVYVRSGYGMYSNIIGPYTGDLTFYTSGTEKMRILSSGGNVGIGTTSPTAKLTVSGNLFLLGINAQRQYTYYAIGSASDDIWFRSSTSFANNGASFAMNLSRLNYQSAGSGNDLNDKVGIWLRGFYDNSGGGLPIYLGGYAYSSQIPAVTITGLNADGTGGNLGIGTTAPISKLNAYASGSNLSVFKVDGGNGTLFEVTDQLSGSLFSVNDVSGLPLLEVFSNNRIVAGKYGSNALVISGSSVGIGTTTPAYKLQVNGSFGATTKSFVIDHPTKEGKKLVYGSLESPYHGIRLTGRNMLIDGECKVQLPDYIYKLARPESVNIQITPIKCGKVIYVDEISVENNYFVVKYDKSLLESYKNYEFFWDFTATRSDVEQLVVEQ